MPDFRSTDELRYIPYPNKRSPGQEQGRSGCPVRSSAGQPDGRIVLPPWFYSLHTWWKLVTPQTIPRDCPPEGTTKTAHLPREGRSVPHIVPSPASQTRTLHPERIEKPTSRQDGMGICCALLDITTRMAARPGHGQIGHLPRQASISRPRMNRAAARHQMIYAYDKPLRPRWHGREDIDQPIAEPVTRQ